MTTMQFWNWQGDILVLRCQIQARAARDGYAERGRNHPRFQFP